MPRAESCDAAHKLRCARSAARLAPQRAPNTAAACPEPKRAKRLWKTRSRSANKAQTYKELTEQAPAIFKQSAIGPAPTSRPSANESLQPRAEGAALL